MGKYIYIKRNYAKFMLSLEDIYLVCKINKHIKLLDLRFGIILAH